MRWSRDALCKGTVAALLLAWPAFATPAEAPRVITMAPHLAELVCEVAGCEYVVGVTDAGRYPGALDGVPRLGSPEALDIDALRALQPSLVLVWQDRTPDDTVRALRRIGLRIESVRASRSEDIGGALEQLGGLLGQRAKGIRLAEQFRESHAALKAEFAQREPTLSVFYQASLPPLQTVDRGTLVGEAIELCGGSNIFPRLPPAAPSVPVDRVVLREPQVIIFGMDDGHDQARAQWAAFDTLPAVKLDGFVDAVRREWLTRATPRFLDGVRQLCEEMDAIRQRIAEN